MLLFLSRLARYHDQARAEVKSTAAFCSDQTAPQNRAVLAIMGGLGFLIGLALILLDTGNVLEYPPHFLVGCTIVLCLLSTFLISRKIKGPDSPYRTPHFVLGIAILCLYLIQVFLGIGVMF
jgi:hypothetical protein